MPEHEVANNAGLWTWLTLLFFDDVCPVQNGQRKVKNDYCYVFEPKIEPDVLSKDRPRFEQTGDEKYVTKAHRRGKVGWNVGRQIEVAPHYRRPHMALVWTGGFRTFTSCEGGKGHSFQHDTIGLELEGDYRG
ncbi:MAG: hypothetical protein ABIP48_29025 [Planctomycetota bacterium]